MNRDYPDLALDKDGIPILTDLVPDEAPDKSPTAGVAPPPPPPPPVLSANDIAREFLNSETVRQELDQMASDLARDVHLLIEQTLAETIDEAINRSLERHNNRATEHIRKQLDAALPRLIARALQDSDLPT